ncbi:MAG: porin [Desulfobacterales bacterium]|nr:porin [Desulfobacterales bacterium]
MRKIIVLLTGLILLLPSLAGAYELYKSGDVSLNVGYWGQAWYQHVSDYDTNGDGVEDDSLNDFMIRRSYFSVSGTATPELSFFMHYAADRLGQQDLDNSGMGLGSGLAVRDAWVNYKILGNDFMLQMGRMYVPFTRNYGTTSTKALLTTELNWGQGGIRSGIFYPSKVGRDDSATVWGNVLDDKLQYRFMVGEGAESAAKNPDDELRYAGRVSYNLLDPETSWFNKGTNLGGASIIAIGAGFDYQPDLVWDGAQDDYRACTFDVHVDMPLGAGAVTGDAAYINIDNSANGVTDSDLAAGGDGEMITGQLGYLFYDRIQPFGHVEAILPDADGTEDTMVYGLGCNYYIKGLANKLTLEWTTVASDSNAVEDKDIVTLQAAFGF